MHDLSCMSLVYQPTESNWTDLCSCSFISAKNSAEMLLFILNFISFPKRAVSLDASDIWWVLMKSVESESRLLTFEYVFIYGKVSMILILSIRLSVHETELFSNSKLKTFGYVFNIYIQFCTAISKLWTFEPKFLYFFPR